jgi:hypothetical protein
MAHRSHRRCRYLVEAVHFGSVWVYIQVLAGWNDNRRRDLKGGRKAAECQDKRQLRPQLTSVLPIHNVTNNAFTNITARFSFHGTIRDHMKTSKISQGSTR